MSNNPLLQLMKEKVPDLTKPELDLLDAIQNGSKLDFILDDEELLEPCKITKWSEEKVIRAEVINSICATKKIEEYLHPKGIQIRGSKIEGELDLENIVFPFPLRFHNCYFDQRINLAYANIAELDLSSSCVKEVFGPGLTVNN